MQVRLWRFHFVVKDAIKMSKISSNLRFDYVCPTYSCTLHDLCCCTLASWSDDFKGIFIIAGLMLAFIICQFLLQSTMLQGIERYLKQAIVDKNASVSSASLVSALVGVSSILKMWLFIKSNHSNSDLNSCSWYVVSKITSQKHLCGFSKYPYPFVRPGGWGGGRGGVREVPKISSFKGK